MSETRKDVKQVQVDYLCPKCNIGHLRPTGTVFPTNPPQFAHKCNNCDYMETFLKQYPYIDYVEIITNPKARIGIKDQNIVTAAGDYSTTALYSCTTGEYVCQTNIVNTPSNNGNVSSCMHYDINSIIPSNNGNNF